MLDRSWAQTATLAVSAKMPPEKARVWETQAGKLIFKYLRALFHHRTIDASYRAIVEEHGLTMAGVITEEETTSSYCGPLAEPLFFHLDAFFEAAKTAQDFTLPCLGSAGVLTSPPNSLHKYCSRAAPDTLPAIDHVLRDGWIAFGDTTKRYRDCLSHHVALSGHLWQTAINMKWRAGTWTAHLFLPDNPGAQSYDSFAYDRRLEALEICTGLLNQTAGLLRATLEACVGAHGADPSQVPDVPLTLRNVMLGE